MTEFVAFNGMSEVQLKQWVAYLFAQSSVGKASTGVLSGLTVAQTATASGSVLVAAGAGVVQASTGDGASPLVNPSQVTLDIFTANPMGAVARNDIVVFDAATASIRSITGTPNAVPTDPTVPTSAIPLARLRHAASATTIPTSAMDDLRTFTGLLSTDTGVVSGGVTAATGWSLVSSSYRIVGGMVHLYVRFDRTGAAIVATASTDIGNSLMGTASAALIPPIPVGGAHGTWGGVATTVLWSDGTISLTATAGDIATGDDLDASFVYPEA